MNPSERHNMLIEKIAERLDRQFEEAPCLGEPPAKRRRIAPEAGQKVAVNYKQQPGELQTRTHCSFLTNRKLVKLLKRTLDANEARHGGYAGEEVPYVLIQMIADFHGDLSSYTHVWLHHFRYPGSFRFFNMLKSTPNGVNQDGLCNTDSIRLSLGGRPRQE